MAEIISKDGKRWNTQDYILHLEMKIDQLQNNKPLKLSGNMIEIPMDENIGHGDIEPLDLEKLALASAHYVAYTVADNILENLIHRGGKEESITIPQRENWITIHDILKKVGFDTLDIEDIHEELDRIADGISNGCKL